MVILTKSANRHIYSVANRYAYESRRTPPLTSSIQWHVIPIQDGAIANVDRHLGEAVVNVTTVSEPCNEDP